MKVISWPSTWDMSCGTTFRQLVVPSPPDYGGTRSRKSFIQYYLKEIYKTAKSTVHNASVIQREIHFVFQRSKLVLFSN